MKTKYYDGHYVDSGLSAEERERLLKEALENDRLLTEWPNEDE